MPTTRPRHLITETDQVSRALAAAAKRWPEESSPTKLLARLVEEGRRALDEQGAEAEQKRRDGLTRSSGALTGVYGPNYLAELREDWPE